MKQIIIAIGVFLAIILGMSPAMADQATLFTDPITPESVRGKVFVFKNLDKSCIDSTDGSRLFRRGEEEGCLTRWDKDWGGEKFMLFFIGTDEGKDRHHFAIVRQSSGQLVDVAGKRPGRGSAVQIWNGFVKNWTDNDQVFYFEAAPNGSNSWLIKTWYDELCWAGWKGKDHIYIETLNGSASEAWQLYQVGQVDFPATQKATRNQVVSQRPTWNKIEDPDPATDPSLYQWQTVGSTLMPYFMAVNSDQFATSIKDSPYYKLERGQRWMHHSSQANFGSGQITITEGATKGWSKEKSSSFSTSVGISISATFGASGGALGGVSVETSMTVSTELSWGWTTTDTVSGEKSFERQFPIPPGVKTHFWQIEERFVLYNQKGRQVESWELPTDQMINTEVSLGELQAKS